MNKPRERYWLDWLSEVISWIRIMISPTLIGAILGAIVMGYWPTIFGIITGCVIALVGIIIGVRWANRVRKKHGTTYFMSRLYSTSEFEKEERPSERKRN